MVLFAGLIVVSQFSGQPSDDGDLNWPSSFQKVARVCFGYLVTDYGFVEVPADADDYELRFRKDALVIKIGSSMRGLQLSVNLAFG